MRNGVVRYIVELLEMGHTVQFGQLGEFTHLYEPAHYNSAHTHVHPPASHLDFNGAVEADDDSLVKYIHYRAGLTIADATRHVDAFVGDIMKELDRNSYVRVEHFGRFRKDGEILRFAADPEIENLRFKDLMPVSLPSVVAETEHVPEPTTATRPVGAAAVAATAEVKASQVSDPTDPTPAPEPVEESNDSTTEAKRNPLAVVIPLFIMIFVIVVIMAILQYNRSHEDPFASTIFNKAPVPTNPVIGDDVNPPHTSETTATAELDSEQMQFDIIPNLEFEGLDTSDSLEYEAPIELPDKSNVDPGSTEEMIRDGALDEKLASADAEPSKYENCYVVVGAFGVQSNVTRMIDRLNEMGYAADTMPNRGLTQVGVPAECNSAEIREILQVLQAQVESEAWILKK